MSKLYTKLQLVAVAASLLSITAIPAHAQMYDTASVKIDQALADRLPEKMKTAGELTIGSDTAYAPWEFLSEKDGQTPEGIDVDIAKAIGNRLGVKINYQTSAFDAILPALGAKYDLGISAFSITNERMKVVNFVSYTETGSLWAVQVGNPTNFDPTDICGRKIAIMSGTYQERQVNALNEECKGAGKPVAELVPFKSLPEALTRLRAGGAEAMVSGEAGIGYAKTQSGQFDTIRPTTGQLSRRGPNGIAVAKNDMAITELIRDTINSLIEDGTYKRILDAWGVGSTMIEKATINPDVKV